MTNSVEVGHLYRREVDGSIQGVVSAQASADSAAFFAINCGGIAGPGDAAAGSIRSFNGDIRRVKATGAIRGSIDVDAGSILRVETGTANGSDGNLEGNVTASDGIGNMLIAGRILGSHVKAIDGDLFGQLTATELCCKAGTSAPASITIGGNVAGNIDITTSFIAPVTINGILEPGVRITLGNGLSANGDQLWIKTAGGLQGEIIMNADDAAPTNVWNQDIKIGTTNPIILGGQQSGSTPYYSQTSSTLGGGAVGLARFHLHDTECDPVNGATIDGILSWAVLSFYGPVEKVPTATYPVKVEYLSGSTWTDITSDFEFWTSGRDLFVSALTPEDFDADYTYRITPTNLRCVGVTGTPAVASFTYTLVPN